MKNRILLLFLFLGFSTSLIAQKVSYPQMVHRTQTPTVFINDIILPGDDGKTTLAFIFRFDNEFIPFKKLSAQPENNPPDSAQFYATIRLNTEIFEGKKKNRNNPSNKAVARASWSDTLFTESFEQTQSDELYASGSFSTQLNPGDYNFVLQLTMMQERNEQTTRRRNIKIHDIDRKKTGEIYLIRDKSKSDNGILLELMNMEHNAPFGKDFIALIRIPDYDDSAEYELNINKAQISKKDTTARDNKFSAPLKSSDIFPHSTIILTDTNKPSLLLKQDEYSYTYAIVTIPASKFENASYLITLNKDDYDLPVTRGLFQSYWPNMPASLYNVDIAIKMLKYIVGEKELDRMNNGSDKEKEKKFREFWKSKDPTPETAYNELMAEYYRRIDYAFKNFGTQEFPLGHETDQGEVYIKYGPPNSKDRVFPPDGNTRELWKYPNRTFIFEATSGFGDFKLVGTQ